MPLTQSLQNKCHASSAPVFEATQDGDGVDDGGLADVDLLEPPLERRVLLDVFPVFVLPCQCALFCQRVQAKGRHHCYECSLRLTTYTKKLVNGHMEDRVGRQKQGNASSHAGLTAAPRPTSRHACKQFNNRARFAACQVQALH